MKTILIIAAMAILAGCSHQIRPEYTATIDYGYNFRTGLEEEKPFVVDFSRNSVKIDGQYHDLKFEGCYGQLCLWSNDIISLEHDVVNGLITVSLEYEDRVLEDQKKFAQYRVSTMTFATQQKIPGMAPERQIAGNK